MSDRPILVGYDGSDDARSAIRVAGELRHAGGRRPQPRVHLGEVDLPDSFRAGVAEGALQERRTWRFLVQIELL